MSFTEDELQAFNSILEQRLAAHRQEMEQALDQRLNDFRQNIDQRLVSSQQGTDSALKQELAAWKEKPDLDFVVKLQEQQDQNAQAFNQQTEQKIQQVEAALDRMLAAQLLGIEQLLNQHISRQNLEIGPLAQDLHAQLEGIEVQTELPWGSWLPWLVRS